VKALKVAFNSDFYQRLNCLQYRYTRYIGVFEMSNVSAAVLPRFNEYFTHFRRIARKSQIL